ncbi:capsid protein [Anaerotruncus sp. 80]|uniref:Capsid protein n=1 Tax=Anaerotruncus colihominis TaxID=169435 RepID=A0A845QJ15_9FIRM|nr:MULTISPECIES: capsid protein [Anaerotruncus]NBH61576.1 capsid protein [Anaerotruncus colihominis]NCF02231.1 capsid protein [Anaerotruncus sp. 80]
MAVYEYAEKFTNLLQQKYAKELCSDTLTKSNTGVTFINAQTIKLPRMAVSGYKDHTRTPGFNSGSLSNDWEAKKLSHDRDIEFFVDPMDIDETNLTLSVANIQNTFETEQAIPEKDCYRFSKLHAELTNLSGRIDTTVVTAANFLEWFDEEMARMDEASVPEEGRILYVTPSMNKILKEAEGIQRVMMVSTPSSVNRNVHSLDDVTKKMVPAARMKSKYDFTDGFAAAEDAKQINCILIHPSCVVCRDKYSYIKLFTPGTDSRTADGYLYQNRNYGDLFLLERKVEGCAMNVSE